MLYIWSGSGNGILWPLGSREAFISIRTRSRYNCFVFDIDSFSFRFSDGNVSVFLNEVILDNILNNSWLTSKGPGLLFPYKIPLFECPILYEGACFKDLYDFYARL